MLVEATWIFLTEEIRIRWAEGGTRAPEAPAGGGWTVRSPAAVRAACFEWAFRSYCRPAQRKENRRSSTGSPDEDLAIVTEIPRYHARCGAPDHSRSRACP